MSLDLAATVFVTLFVVIDPVGLAPLFLALTRGMGQEQRISIGLRAIGIGRTNDGARYAKRAWRKARAWLILNSIWFSRRYRLSGSAAVRTRRTAASRS